MVEQVTRQSKTSQPVSVEVVDMHAGLYRTGSTDGVSFYRTDVKHGTCSCAAGMNGFRGARIGMCRHLVAAKVIARALASMQPAERAAALKVQHIRVNVAVVNVSGLDAPLAHRPARAQTSAAALLEAFGIN